MVASERIHEHAWRRIVGYDKGIVKSADRHHATATLFNE